MSENNQTCMHPELRPEDGKCSEEQIQKCHGNKNEHPCDSEEE